MTVAELKEKLDQFSDDTEVYVCIDDENPLNEAVVIYDLFEVHGSNKTDNNGLYIIGG